MCSLWSFGDARHSAFGLEGISPARLLTRIFAPKCVRMGHTHVYSMRVAVYALWHLIMHKPVGKIFAKHLKQVEVF